MIKIRHIAIASEHPGKAAEFYKAALGWKEVARFGLGPDGEGEAPRASGVTLTDGSINISLIKFGRDQIGKGIDYRGLHHIGVVVGDVDAWTGRLEALGAPCIVGKDEMPANAHFEIKFRGPDDVVFDISDSPWPGSAPLEEAEKEAMRLGAGE